MGRELLPRRTPGGRTAQAVVEFALATPVLLLLVLGPLDMGRAVLEAASLANAVRDGARQGAIIYSAAGWEADTAAAVRSAGVLLDPARLVVTVSSEITGASTFVRVDASYGFRVITPLVAPVAGEITLQSGTRMLARRG